MNYLKLYLLLFASLLISVSCKKEKSEIKVIKDSSEIYISCSFQQGMYLNTAFLN